MNPTPETTTSSERVCDEQPRAAYARAAESIMADHGPAGERR